MLFSSMTVLLLAGLGQQGVQVSAAANIPAFSPLSCNANIDVADCSVESLSSLVTTATGGDQVVVPCGTCATFDITDGSTLTVPGGINVEGRLLVPETANGILNTTSLIIQGKFSVDNPLHSNSFTLNLFGTDNILFFPHSDNSHQCGENTTTFDPLPCDLGKKPIAVLGGSLDVDALPPGKDSCPSWVKLKSKSSSIPATADDLIPDSPNVQGIASSNERYASATSKVSHLGSGEYVITGAYKNMGLRMRLKPLGSFERTNAIGKTLTLSWSYKVSGGGADLGWRGVALMRWARYTRPKGTMWLPDSSGSDCNMPTTGEWATCTTTFTYTSGIAAWDWNDINLVFTGDNWSSRSSTYTFHFKDIKIENLVDIVESPDVLEVGVDASGCWNVGDEILITSSKDNPNGHVLRSIIGIDTSNGLIKLDNGVNPLDNILLSEADEGQDGLDFAVEIASLNRKVKFTAEEDDVDVLHGGHLIIYYTPDVPQLLRGVEISNFGQQGIMGRYPIHIHMSENSDQTIVAKNVIRESNQRCVVIHGSHNSTVYDNVAFGVIGHCYMLENGGEWYNTFERNLGCNNARHQIEAEWTRSDIAEPALFLISNPQNYFINNVAAGSDAHGFWFELLPRVIGESAQLAINSGFAPREASLIDGGFVGNVAHSCSQDGITSQGNAYQFQTRWFGQAGKLSVLENIKSYKNTKDGIMVNARFVHIKGSVFADNDRCINFPLKTMGGSGNIVEDTRCVAVSNHMKKLGRICHSQFEKSNPEPGFAGISFHINKADGNAETFKNISFEGFSNLESCWEGQGTAIQVLDPFVLNNKRWTGPAWFGEGLTFDGPSFDIKCSMLDWSRIDSDHDKAFQNIYVNDNSGSVGSAATLQQLGPGAFFATPERDPDGTAFVDKSTCTNIALPDSCGMYCEGPCMRRISVQNDPTQKDVVMVISDGSTTYKYERNPNAIYYPRWKPDYEAILPAGPKYTVSFENSVSGLEDWPSYAKLVFGGEPTCSNFIKPDDVELAMPDSTSLGLCSEMTTNGDFQTGDQNGWYFSWFGFDIIQETNSTNYYLRTKNRKLTRSNVYTFVDMSCMKKGQRYRVTSRMRIQSDSGTEKSCTASAGDCPSLSLRFTKGDDQNAPITSYVIGQPIVIPGDGTWADFEATVDLTSDIPADAYQALVMFRLPAKIYSSLLLDDFKMEHVGPIPNNLLTNLDPGSQCTTSSECASGVCLGTEVCQ